MSTKAVNKDGISRAAKTYNNVLRVLPYFVFQEAAKKLRINIIEVDGEDILISKRRKADFLRPYVPGLTLGQKAEVMKFYESKLKPELVYAEINDNITQYKDKKIISNAGEPIDNKSKKHPLELLILKSLVTSVSEDVLFNLFHAQRDTASPTAATSFNGFFYKLSALATQGEIAEANRNLRLTGAFVGSDDPTNFANYTRMVNFLRSGHPLLRQSKTLLYASESVMNLVRDDFRKIVRSHDYPTMAQVVEKLRGDTNTPGLEVVTHEAYGTGSQLILTKPGNFDLGVGSTSDSDFVQVRDPHLDPNIVQFWIQAAYDTRIQDVHEKLFQMNEQTNEGLNFAGDY